MAGDAERRVHCWLLPHGGGRVATMAKDFDRNASDDESRLAPMSQLDDYEVASGHPDVRGWVVVSSDNRTLGSVRELIIDTRALRTRYLEVMLDRSAAGATGERSVLVPIGSASLDTNDDRVVLDAAIVSRLASLPEYTQSAVTRDYEKRLLPALGATLPASG